ncbi:hypothetical protein FRC12_005891 [Ceratobasidium sp. 428]|nr:hypothetical protein FRC12_005891 [Ceratobasidium sp. 428]
MSLLSTTVTSTNPILVLPVLAEPAEPAGAVEPADAAAPVNPPNFTDLVTVDPPPPINLPAPADITFKVGEQPNGMPGKSTSYNLRETLGMATPDYLYVMNRVQTIGEQQGFNWHIPVRNQPAPAVQRIVDEAKSIFPHLNDFSECDDPQWPIQAFIRVVLKRVAHAT